MVYYSWLGTGWAYDSQGGSAAGPKDSEFKSGSMARKIQLEVALMAHDRP